MLLLVDIQYNLRERETLALVDRKRVRELERKLCTGASGPLKLKLTGNRKDWHNLGRVQREIRARIVAKAHKQH